MHIGGSLWITFQHHFFSFVLYLLKIIYMTQDFKDTWQTAAVLGSSFVASDIDLNIDNVSQSVTLVGQAIIAVLGAVFAIMKVFKKR